MKIGILSMQRIKNYGSFLQAYALQEILRSMGNTVQFVDIECVKCAKSFPDKASYIFNKLKRIKYLDKYLFKRIEYSKKNSQMDLMFIDNQRIYLGISEQIQTAAGCDAVVIGSDEIFNCDSKSFWGVTPQRFGQIQEIPITLSYAASCGYTDATMLSNKDKVIVQNSLMQMRDISVRDQNTYEFIRQMTGRKAKIHLDPVLMYDYEQELTEALDRELPEYPYMIVYAYHNRIEASDEIYAIKSYAKRKGLRTIAIGGSLPWCDEFAVVNPFQVLAYFKSASCIVTDTFHGCVIAAKFNKPLAVLVRDSNKNKLGDLLLRLQINEHRVNSIDMLESILEMPCNYDACNQVICSEKEHTAKYLQNALGQI